MPSQDGVSNVAASSGIVVGSGGTDVAVVVLGVDVGGTDGGVVSLILQLAPLVPIDRCFTHSQQNRK